MMAFFPVAIKLCPRDDEKVPAQHARNFVTVGKLSGSLFFVAGYVDMNSK